MLVAVLALIIGGGAVYVGQKYQAGTSSEKINKTESKNSAPEQTSIDYKAELQNAALAEFKKRSEGEAYQPELVCTVERVDAKTGAGMCGLKDGGATPFTATRDNGLWSVVFDDMGGR